MLTDVGGVVAVTSTDANEEEVDDIVNRCGDYYDDSAVKSDFHDKKMKGKVQFKKKQEMGEQRKAKTFLPEPSDKVLRAYAKSDERIARATDFMGKKHGVEMEERQSSPRSRRKYMANTATRKPTKIFKVNSIAFAKL